MAAIRMAGCNMKKAKNRTRRTLVFEVGQISGRETENAYKDHGNEVW